MGLPPCLPAVCEIQTGAVFCRQLSLRGGRSGMSKAAPFFLTHLLIPGGGIPHHQPADEQNQEQNRQCGQAAAPEAFRALAERSLPDHWPQKSACRPAGAWNVLGDFCGSCPFVLFFRFQSGKFRARCSQASASRSRSTTLCFAVWRYIVAGIAYPSRAKTGTISSTGRIV